MRCAWPRPIATTIRLALPASWRPMQAACGAMADRAMAGPSAKPKVIIVTGPTAVGKTKIGLELAKRLGGEVISADSVQVHTGLDVGSDKLPEAQRQGIKHHLIDVLPPTAEFSAGEFYELGRKAAEDILRRGKVPIVVGGTGFYLRWFVLGKPQTPTSSPELMRRVHELVQELWDAAAAVISDLGDPDAAARVRAERHNWYRLQRVCQILLQNGGRPLAEVDIDTSRELDYDFRCFFLHRPRKQLYDKIAYRVEEMVAGGLLREARELMELGVSAGSCNAARAIGYRQALEFMEEARRQGGAAAAPQLLDLIRKIGVSTRKLVKAQHTWFRDDAAFKWVDAAGPEGEALGEILAELEKPQHEGGCGDSGRLDKEAFREMREYVQPIVLFKDPDVVSKALEEVRQLLGGGGGGGEAGGGGGEAGGAAAAAGRAAAGGQAP
ncbi:MAG: IPP transferase-domain-containing protein [Monoraphidium minutum]|nr:MAG: IPP transferase-domain-containing protein [Monoraphidium minutum]